nr:DUF2177 family protein [Rhodoplanes serenus]
MARSCVRTSRGGAGDPPGRYRRIKRDNPVRQDRLVPYVASYAAALVSFVIIDAVWLYTMSGLLYRPTLGDILLEAPRMMPAVVFYLLFPIGLVVFAIVPALRGGGLVPAIALGALFGALAYATYDLTNYATLRNWTLQLTVADIVWGGLLSGIAAACGYLAANAVRGTIAA